MHNFDANCRLCPRLSSFLDQVKAEHPDYHAAPVPAFGPKQAQLLIVGLAPGMHGANRTGRPFTGDQAGVMLYDMLYRFGFSNQPTSTYIGDGMKLKNCRITNAVKCLPPENKPIAQEINICNQFLSAELHALATNSLILALGGIAHKAVVKAYQLKQKDYPFGHGNEHALVGDRWLLDSYHCSRYNTQTGRLTETMFADIFTQATALINRASAYAK